jgi:anti-sigma regulatory factor (Ser/Thr protein kinase)
VPGGYHPLRIAGFRIIEDVQRESSYSSGSKYDTIRMIMERKFKREIGSLEEIFTFIDEFLADIGVDEDTSFYTRLVAEELFTNLVRHNIGGRDHILISLEMDSNRLVIELRDFDVEPVVTPQTEVDVRKRLDERKVGGLGIHLVRSYVDTLTYDYNNGTLSVTAVKTMEDSDV